MTSAQRRGVLAASLLAMGLGTAPARAAVRPPESALTEKAFRRPEMHVPEVHQPAGEVPRVAGALRGELDQLGVLPEQGFFDARSGRWSALVLSRPLIPGTGLGNALRWDGVVDDNRIRARAWSALRAFLEQHRSRLRIDLSELPAAPRVDVFEDGALVLIHADRVAGGVPVRDSSLTATVNHGNLILLGLRNWGDVSLPAPGMPADAARARVEQHLAPIAVGLDAGRLEVIPTLREGSFDMRLAWVFQAAVDGDVGSWEGLVDAVTGELLAFEDRNQYARRVKGGVYPVSNDQRPPDGVEQPGWPMPHGTMTVGGSPVTSTTGGNFGCGQGTATFALSGPFVRMNDSCGAANESSASGDLDLGFGPTPAATDCEVPPGHSPGDTKSSRSGFYELNRIVEQAKGYLPANAWLQAQLTSNMNLPQTCNAFWNGSTVNFFRSAVASGCRNTGEIAAIFDHEWGHGMDDNGTNGNISSPGEGIADIHAFLRLNTSCIGRGFRINSVCGGYGDACDGTAATGCTGVRDIDWLAHRCNRPHTVTWITQGFTSAQCGGTGSAPACPGGTGTPCGRATHCEGYVVGETAFDLARRDLTAAPFNFDSNTAHELTTRLFMLGSQAITSWYTCNVGGGCGATAGYMQVLAADDDNGNLTDGTPHMTAIRAAFERHEIHCATPAAVNSGCAGGPTTAPTVTAVAAGEGVNLSWNAVAGASRYYVYRTEGVAACNFGKVKVGDVTGTTFSDTGLMAGRAYSYVVLPVGANTSCFGRASACATATPTDSQCVVQSVAPIALAVDGAGNGVLQPNEAPVTVAPTWRNTGNVAIALTGDLSAFTGPGGPTYTIADASAGYGTIPVSSDQGCTDCYAVGITAGARPAQHWDSTALETVNPTATQKSWTLHVGDSFTDVPGTGAFFRFVETLLHRSVTGGCGAGVYCPVSTTSREQMAVFVLAAKEGSGYAPPACVPPNLFSDVPDTSPFCRWIEELANRGVVAGCGLNLYCPSADVTREQMSIFVLRTLDPALSPPACAAGSELFGDVPASSVFCRWIEELARRGVVTGCGGGNYCPASPVTREQMAVFLTVTFGLTLYGL